MRTEVMRREPSVPAWAWTSAVLAILLLVTVVWWASGKSAVIVAERSRPHVTVTELPQTKVSQPSQDAASVSTGSGRRVDWSQPSADFQPPVSEQMKTITVEAPKEKTAKAEPEKIVLPPTPRLTSGTEMTGPDRFVYNDTVWVLSRSAEVTADEVDLTQLGTVDGHSLYVLSGSASEPSALFVEVSPGSGQYGVYRPTG